MSDPPAAGAPADPPPTLAAFVAAPPALVAPLVPATVIYAPAGTRRAAALAGIAGDSAAFMSWSFARLLDCLALLFRDGVQHIVTSVLTPSQFNEVGQYAAQLPHLVDAGFAGEAACAEYTRRGWRVRLLGAEHLPTLQPAADRLRAATPAVGGPTLWGTIVPDYETFWRDALLRLRHSAAQTQAEAIQAVYGAAIPPAGLFLSFNKLIIAPDLLPPLLMGQVHCYWSQRPGYSLDARQWRTILYDYAYLRPTWRADKTGRAAGAQAHRAAWLRGPILGLGQRLGEFWYPDPDQESLND